MLRLIFFAFGLLLSNLAISQTRIQLTDFVGGFSRPVDIAHCGDSRLFVVEQNGKIWIVDSLGVKSSLPFLDIDPRVNSNGNEQGLLGLAFHPNYAQNGFFYVNYINNSGDTRVVRFSRDSTNASLADPDSELTLLQVDQPYSNHNGGCIKFGPDGYLYASLGDGGSGGDPQNYGQTKNTLLGKMLRINVDSVSNGNNYAIPASNPFANDPAYKPEIWSLGLRNVWRFSFDRVTGDMWMGDVGQNKQEEVDFEPANMGGINYGWRCYEGLQPYNTAGCQSASFYQSPVLTYPNPSKGCSITGGFIYRGNKYPDMYGTYLVADYCSGRFWTVRQTPAGGFSTEEIANLGDYEFSTFGEDNKGELYVALLSSGKIQKIKDACTAFQISADFPNGNAVCSGANTASIAISATGTSGTVTYAWSNGGSTAQQTNLGAGQYTVTVTNGNGCARTGAYTIAQQGPTAPQIAASSTTLCAGGTLDLIVTNIPVPSTLIWTLPDGSTSTVTANDSSYYFTVNEPGAYTVQLSDSACVLTASLVIDPVLVLTPLVQANGDSLRISGGSWATFQWLLNGQPIPGATDSTYVATQSGAYSVVGTVLASGCPYASTTVDVVISDTRLPASVASLSLTPNPTSGLMAMSLRLQSMQRMRIFLLDARQQQIFSQTKQTDALELPIDLRALPAGTYMLHIQLENGEQVVRKLVRQ
jgi:glucose/arabinose dehydrogenase